MKFSGSDSAVEFESDNPANALRRIEAQFEWKAEDWHFWLLKSIEPIKVYAFFKRAKLLNGKLFFDGREKSSDSHAYQWAQERYKPALYEALGDLEVCLADGGKVIKNFFTGKVPGSLGKDKVNEMFKQAMMHVHRGATQ